MIRWMLCALALLLSAVSAYAQNGATSPVSKPPPNAAPIDASAASNPFRRKPAVVADPVLVVEAPKADLRVEALQARWQELREKGERLGTINGKNIYRFKDRYLIEEPPTDPLEIETPDGPALNGQCVIQVIAGPAAKPKSTLDAPSK